MMYYRLPSEMKKSLDLRHKRQPPPKPQAMFRVFDVVEINVNKGIRLARVLAVNAERGIACVEYTMPSGTTGLQFISLKRLDLVGPQGAPRATLVDERPCTYRQLTKEWLEAIVSQGGAWKGKSSAGQVPAANVLLLERFEP